MKFIEAVLQNQSALEVIPVMVSLAETVLVF